MSLPVFAWLSQSPSPPARWDMRLLDWGMVPAGIAMRETAREPVLLDWREGHRHPDWRECDYRGNIAVIGVEYYEERAELLEMGFGEVLDSYCVHTELAQRLLRLDGLANSIPRRLMAGPVTLDLFHRDAELGGAWLGLDPREFALLWRLASTPHARISRRELLADHGRIDFDAGKTLLDMHVLRLRGKLAAARCDWLVEAHADGGYRLGRPPLTQGRSGSFAQLVPGQLDTRQLDTRASMRNEGRHRNSSERPFHAVPRSRFD